ncbi:antitoxin HicB [Methylobacterium sp. 174MFSha1.1]|nr:antitoxin HicB [Methylobacterium sp. 174MFSha1.1]
MMPTGWTYPVELRREGDEVEAYCSSMPEAIAGGPTEADALREMQQALVCAVRGRIKDGMDLVPPDGPRPSERHAVSLPAHLAAKASVYVAWRRSGLSKVALAERLGRNEVEVRRILDPDYGTKIAQLEEATAALGGRLVVSFELAR